MGRTKLNSTSGIIADKANDILNGVTETAVDAVSEVALTATKKMVSFALITCNRLSHLIRSGVKITGDSSIVNIEPSDPHYDEKVAFMRNSKSNRINGGTTFVELSAEEVESSGKCLLDSLNDLSNESLMKMIEKKEPSDVRLSRGGLMMKIMKEKGVM